MGITRQIMDFSQDVSNITQSQVSAKQSTMDQNCLKSDPVHKGYVYNEDQQNTSKIGLIMIGN